MKKTILLLLGLLMLCLCCCGHKNTELKTESGLVIQTPSEEDPTCPPEKGETVATITVRDFGDIKIKFFAKSAPKAVENFLTLAESGYYDGVIFHRVADDFMIQGGDPTGTGSGGQSCWGGEFEDEFSDRIPIRGALCMANRGANTNSSQFFIVQTAQSYEDYLPMLDLTDAQRELFLEYGGTPWLYEAHTVFGQVYEGMDVVDRIAAVSTDENDRPLEDVVIESITVSNAE